MTHNTRISPEIPFLRAEFPEDLLDYLKPVFESGYVGAGPRVEAFEQALANYLGVPYVICTSSCTAALILSYIECTISHGSTVLSTPITCAATNIPLLHLGASIKWLDVDPVTGNVTTEAVMEGLRRYPNAALITIMDWGGRPCDYEGIEAIAASHGIPVILDAAQSFGSTYHGSRFGSHARFVCYSFGPTKTLSAVEGGAIATHDEAAAERLRIARWYGIDRNARDRLAFWNYQIDKAGYRFTSNDVFATIGLSLLPQLENRLRHQRQLAALYANILTTVPGIIIPPREEVSESNYWMFTVLAENRGELLNKLHGAHIHAATPHTRNDYLQCFYDMASPFQLPGVDKFSQEYICLPIGPWMDEFDCRCVCETIKSGW